MYVLFFFSSRRRHTRCNRDWSSDVCSSDLERTMKPISQLAKELGLKDDEVLPMGRQLGRVDYVKVLERLKSQTKPNAKYIDVTAITPTPLGEGKSTTTVGLIEGLGKLGKKATAAIRQPRGGPAFNKKGSGGG